MTLKRLIGVVVVGFALVFTATVSAQALHVGALGDVGVGTLTPGAVMHLLRSDGTAQLLVEEASATQGARDLFVLENNGNPEFKMINTGNGNTWSFSAGLRFVVKNNVGVWVSRLSNTGDYTITGQIFTAGGSCGGGCDLLFDPDTHIESIEEHASLMWANSHLPAVGPTVENAPINLSEKTGRMLNELEKAHIYIEQLHNRLAEVESSQASAPNINSMTASLEQLRIENQVLKESQAKILVLQQQQQNDYEQLKSMLVDLQMQTQSQDILVSLEQ